METILDFQIKRDIFRPERLERDVCAADSAAISGFVTFEIALSALFCSCCAQSTIGGTYDVFRLTSMRCTDHRSRCLGTVLRSSATTLATKFDMLNIGSESTKIKRKAVRAGAVVLTSERLASAAVPTLEGSLTTSPGYFSHSSDGANQSDDCVPSSSKEKLSETRGIIGNVMDIAGTIAGGAPGGSLVAGALQLTKWLSGIDDDGKEEHSLYFGTILRSVKAMQEDIKATIVMVADTIAEHAFADLLLRLHAIFDLLNTNFTAKLGEDLNTPEGLHLFIDYCISPNNGLLQTFAAMNRSAGSNSVATIISNLLNDSDFDPAGRGYLNKMHCDLAVAKYKALICAVNLYLTSLHYEIKCMDLVNDIVDKSAWPDYMLATVNTYAPLSDIKSLLVGSGSIIAKISTDPLHGDTSIANVIQRRRQYMISLSDYNMHTGCPCSDIVYEFSDRRLPHPEFAGTLEVVSGRPHTTTVYKYTTDWWFPDRKASQAALEEILIKKSHGFLKRALLDENIKYLIPKGSNAAYNIPCGGYTLYDTYVADPDPLYWFVPGDLRFDQLDRPDGPEVTRFPLPSTEWRRKYIQLYIDSIDSAQIITSRLQPLLKTSSGDDVTSIWAALVDPPSEFNRPLKRPDVSSLLDDTEMVAAAPGSAWSVKNCQVRYGIVFKKKGCPSTIMQLSDWHFCRGKQHPTLCIPIHPGDAIDSIQVSRQFGSAVEGREPSRPRSLETIAVLKVPNVGAFNTVVYYDETTNIR